MSKHRNSRTPARGLVASFAAVALGLSGLVALATGAAAGNADNTNETAYWEAQFSAHSAVCYKYNDSHAPNAHGRIVQDSDNKWSGVVLNTFNQAWPGDHWEALIVNGGPNGDNVVQHPAAGTTYYTPGTNNQGKRYDVSHWIVCKGTTPSVQVTPVAPVFTPPTCDAPGTLVGTDTAQYAWTRTGPDSAAVLTATPIGNVTLTGQTVFGPYDLTQLTGEICLSEQPIIPTTPVTPVLRHDSLAETGFPLLGILGLAGSFSLIGGGLLNARRLIRAPR